VDRVYEKLQEFGSNGATDVVLKEALNVGVDRIGLAMNELLRASRAMILQGNNGVILFKALSEEEQRQFEGLTQEQILVYQIIEESGNMGIWTRDIKRKSNLSQVTIGKIFKVLEQRKLIKAVLPISSKNRKHYLLFNVEPHKDLVGGPWYQDSELDSEFVNVLREQCKSIIDKKKFISIIDLSNLIRKTGVSKVELSLENVQTIVNTLLFDGEIEFIEETKQYKLTKSSSRVNGLTQVPCGVCPVMKVCSDDGDINPTSCPYLASWLAF
jgi:DNA-directed RNA polymerase III subunit RPC6